MNIAFFCWADELNVELFYWSKYFQQYENEFSIIPLIKLKDKELYDGIVKQLSRVNNTRILPVYLKSEDSSFRNVLNPKIFFNDFMSIFKTLSLNKPDVVVCYYVTHAYPLALLRRFLNFSLCVVAMGSDVNLDNSLIQKIFKKFIYQNCKRVFAASWKLKEKIEKDNGIHVIVTPSSTDTSFFKPLNRKAPLREKWGIDSRKVVIISVCRLDKNKAVDILIKSLVMLKNQEILLLVAGEGPERISLEKLTAKYGIQSNVRFLGFRSRDELLELYNLADMFALSSYAEGLPRVLIEAMSCACIPIATEVGSVGAVVKTGINGYAVPPGNPHVFSNIIRMVAGFSEKQKTAMQTMAREAVVEKFDSERVLNLLVKSVNEL